MIKKYFVATSNANKLKEIKEILNSFGIEAEILCPKDFNETTEPVENGFSFKENALIKARFYYDKYHYPTIADDSGICIDYLNGIPNIHSARFLQGINISDTNEFILKLMKRVKNRDASFHCALAYIENGIEKTYESILPGLISYKQEGDFGFGYDPIFYLKEYDKTSAQLTGENKNKVSHRYLVLKEWANEIKNN